MSSNTPQAFQSALTKFYYQYAAKLVAGLGVYNPSTLSFSNLRRMRDYPQIHFGLQLIKLAVLGVEKKVVCDDKDIKKFIEEQYLKPWSKRFARACLNGLDFGYQPIEMVWTSLDYKPEGKEPDSKVVGGPKWVHKELRAPDPENCQWLADAKGNYSGFQQVVLELPKVPADKSVWYAYDDEFGNLYGTPATKPCYTPWYNHEMLTLYMLREAERFGSPFVKVRHPVDVGTDTTRKAAANVIGRDIKDNSYIALSSEQDETGNYLWDVEIVPAEGDSNHWIAKLDYFNREMFRSLHIPDRVATQDEVGSEALGRVHKGLHTQNVDAIAADILDSENEHAVKKLVEYNFPDPPTCYLEGEPLADDKRDFILEVVKSILGKAHAGEPIGWRLMEGARRRLEDMGFEMPEEDEFVPPEPEEPGIQPKTKKKKEPMPKGEGDTFEAEAPAGWNVEFQKLHAGIKADLHGVVDGMESWAKGLGKDTRSLELPYRDDYGRVLGYGATQAYTLATQAQAQELGTTVPTSPEREADITGRVGEVVNKQFSSLAFDLGEALRTARETEHFNLTAEVADKFEKFRDRVDDAVDTELADSFRLGTRTVAANFEGKKKGEIEFGRWVTITGDEEGGGRHVYIEGGQMKTKPGGEVINKDSGKDDIEDDAEGKEMSRVSSEHFTKSVSSHDEPAADVLKSSLDNIYGEEYPEFIEDRLHYYQLKKGMALDGEHIVHANGTFEIRVKSTLSSEDKIDTTTHEFIHALSAEKYEKDNTFRRSVDAEHKGYLKPLGGKSVDALDVAPSNYISHTAYESPEEYLSEAGVFYYNKNKKKMITPQTRKLLRQLTKSKK